MEVLVSDLNIGFIGAGLMGHGIVKNISKNGGKVAFLDHPGNRPSEDLVALGAARASSIADVVNDADIVCLCVTGSPQVEAIVFEGGLLDSLKAGALVVDHSTAMPDSTRKVAAAVQEKGARYIDAAMTRTPKEAEAGRLNLIVGGSEDDLATAKPLFDCYAENIAHAGPVGAGHTLKLVHNFLSLGKAALVAEAVVCAKAGGVGMETFFDVMETGGGGSTALARMKPYVMDGDDSALTFAIANAAKDLGYYADMAGAAGVPHAGADALAKIFADARDSGAGGKPVPRLVDSLASAQN